MRISAKGRYALASVVFMAQQHESGEYITILSISEKLGISKIYLEQVFSLLKRGNIVNSIKGAMGGYQLTRMPQQITVLDVLKAVELSLFEPAQDTVSENSPEIEAALRLSAFDVLDKAIHDSLCKVSLLDIVNEAEKHKGEEAIMYYI
ncbi:RrF2 family transcriptional regulator [Anaeropeptidivorans aminofermentans]|uniref:RrF2 family transcriptional regulator n=1 Tax=Anaeropeptidivorans aminofermentans TaxID=2934315 RepID=UPI00202419FE|nr:Rrf2 family transcriptional regulator [Anaeropeptidivorans aminofermentans]